MQAAGERELWLPQRHIPRARKQWGHGGKTVSPLRRKSLFPPSLYGACCWPVLSNSLGKGLLEVQSTFIWSVSIRTIFSKTFPLVFATWASRRGNAKELARKIKSWDIKKVLPEQTVRKSLWKCPSLIATAILLRPCLGQQDGFGQKFDVLMWSGFNSPHNSASPGAWPVKRPRNKRDKP